MSTYQTRFLSEIRSGEPIPEGKLAYLRERTKNRIYNYILQRFLDRQREEDFTRADLARRIGRRPEVITRLLGAPGNWTIDTVSDLLVGICAEELEPYSTSLSGRSPRNFRGDEWLSERRTLSNPSQSSVVVKIEDTLAARPMPVPTGNTSRWEVRE